MGHSRTIQVVGFRKSGKTTLINQFIDYAKSEGAKVITIKHHGHPSPLSMPDNTADSIQHFERGADMSFVYGGGVVQVHEKETEDGVLTRMHGQAMLREPDYIFIEGFKQGPFPKIVLFRNEGEEELLDLSEIAETIHSSDVHNDKVVKGLWEKCKEKLK